MTNLQKGDIAPDFTLASENNEKVTLSALRGQPVVLYFYPKDDTSGCTAEAIQFTELKPQFDVLGVTLIGISPDSAAKHQKFRDKYSLTVTLLADEEKKIANLYGVWVEKSMYGRKYMGVERSTFLLDSTGKIAELWEKVTVPGHAQAVLTAAETLVKA
ncbi:thioredoxin-dependent thiol peroxidase [Candidatus Tokpelaia sp.]|uniref:thioredoxin-dependent thiol peroxidase n=1 Tax=Candidatus Tokpelaia sp. TaxID=2233777 RepID=UPI001239039C|nr:thioredoxin-dependent thiol peroxidase [Candidatus Tokpelaia sp.]KAA6404779.1 thioredoxin-dependent thiol peroxidase [Candidatus Tokpelaia sp.]